MYTSKVFLLEKFSFFKFCRKTRYIFFRITQKLQENNYFQGIIFSHMSMSHHPTSFLVLDNKELGTFWVGQVNIKPGANDRAIGVDKLIDKLSSKYEEEYPHLYFDVESIACEIYKFHELEKWITDMLYEINRRPIKLRELHELFSQLVGLKGIIRPIQPYMYYELIKHKRV
jgi:hypothetical protein